MGKKKSALQKIANWGGQRPARFVLFALAVAALSFALAWERVAVLSYNPVNGDFQSYNVFRRVLAGQAPYADFANYIGMAPLVVNLPFMLFGAGNFAQSLFVTNFTANVVFSLCVLAIFWLATENGSLALLCSAVCTKLFSTGILGAVLGGVGRYWEATFAALYTPSNSMRGTRMFWPFLLVLCWLFAEAIYRRKKGVHYSLAARAPGAGFCNVLGLVLGAGVLWSSDFGLAALVAGTVILVALLLRHWPGAKAFAVRGGLFLAGVFAGVFAAALVCTGGHPVAWLRATAAVGGAQYYYYNGMAGRAILPYIFTNVRLLLYTVPCVIFLVFCLVRLVQKKLSDCLLLAGFLAFSVLVASYGYVASGSGYNFTEALEGCFWLAAAALVLRGLLWLARRFTRQVALGATALLCAAALLFCGLAALGVAGRRGAAQSGTHSEALGGPVTYPVALHEAAAFTGGEEVFSVYATGLEVEKGQFQPSGYDYIIHALGGDAQSAYVESFLAGDYRFAQTVDLPLESWLCVENWFFYRQLAAGYERVMHTEYSWIWEKCGDRRVEAQAEVAVERQGASWVITVTAPKDAGDFVADVRLCYDTSFTSAAGAALSLGRRCAALAVEDPIYADGELVGCYIPAQSDGWNIPVTVRDGVGTAILSPSDAAFVEVELFSAVVEDCFLPLLLPAE